MNTSPTPETQNTSRRDPDRDPVRIIYMGTPDFAVPALQALVAHADHLERAVVAVVTQPDRPAGRKRRLQPSPVKEVAQAHSIPVLQPERLRNNPEIAQALTDLRPDLIIVAAYGLILPKTILEIPRFGCINVHASLLPAYRGASPINAAILDGCTETGVSIMRMDEGMDTGPVLAQAATPIAPTDTAQTLSTRLAQLGADLLLETLPSYLAGSLHPVDQAQLPGATSFCGLITKADGRIDWTQSAAHIERMTRAYAPWPGAYTEWQGAPFKIVEARVVAIAETNEEQDAIRTAAPGTVVALSSTGEPEGGRSTARLAVVTGEDLLELVQVQPAGKRAMDIASFGNGAPDFVGSRLGEHAPSNA